MVRELFIKDGSFVGWIPPNVQPSLLGSADAKGFQYNKQNKKDSELAKKKAMSLALNKEKEGWKLVTIRAIYSYGNENPYRYDIESWGGFKE